MGQVVFWQYQNLLILQVNVAVTLPLLGIDGPQICSRCYIQSNRLPPTLSSDQSKVPTLAIETNTNFTKTY